MKVTLLIGRHNERTIFGLVFLVYIIGTWVGLWIAQYYLRDFSDLPDHFWDGKIKLSSMLLPTLVFVGIVLLQRVQKIGRVLLLCYFCVQGCCFAMSAALLIRAYPDIGVFLALYLIAAPAFFLICTGQFCCMQISRRRRLVFIALGLCAVYFIRRWGYDLSTDLVLRQV